MLCADILLLLSDNDKLEKNIKKLFQFHNIYIDISSQILSINCVNMFQEN